MKKMKSGDKLSVNCKHLLLCVNLNLGAAIAVGFGSLAETANSLRSSNRVQALWSE